MLVVAAGLARVALSRSRSCAGLISLTLALAGCTVGPDYVPAPAPVPPNFKEMKGWKIATPADALPRGNWWGFYRDPKLGFLIGQVEISNQNVAAAAASYEQARALIREAQSALFPKVSATYTVTRTFAGANSATTTTGASAGATGITTTTYTPGASASWDLDVWGKVRRQIESNASAAQASKADLDNAKLSAQAQLATAYFNLCAADALYDLLTRTAQDYKKTLEVVRNQFQAGFSVTQADVSTAEAQLANTQAQAINVHVQRAQFEHAIAVLIGRPPAELSIAQRPLSGRIPKIPVAVPSTLIERRPDIAAAERTMQQQNALIGVNIAGYFPDISLSGMVQWTGTQPFPFNVANAVWSLGATGTQVLFDGGLRAAEVDAARALYWQSVANYRQTVLTAFQQVEDQLAAIHYLTRQLAVQRKAVVEQRQAVQTYLNQFQAGTAAFTTVVTAEIQLLIYEQTELTIRQNLFLASVSLIEALGGGWDADLLPTGKELQRDYSPFEHLPSDGPRAPAEISQTPAKN